MPEAEMQGGGQAPYQLHIHFVGIGGTGLSAIALVLLEQGGAVSGSDRADSPALTRLKQRGARVHAGHRAENIAGADLVVVSSAIPVGNPEIDAARAAGIPILTRAEFIGRLLEGRRVIAVAGTHGKTTTTAMIAWILTQAGVQPGFVVGAISVNLGTNARAGSGPWFVIEADEYGHMFWGLEPEVAAITTIELDHPDQFATLADMVDAFRGFVQRVKLGGLVIGNRDDERVRDLLMPQTDLPIDWFAIQEAARWQAVGLRSNDRGGYSFTVLREGITWGEIALQVPGRHNAMNALAAVSAAVRVGVEPEIVCRALSEFRGAERRFEHKGVAAQVDVYDDYAHHPTEVRATLSGARARFPGRRIWAVFQPHTYSRLKALGPDFAGAFHAADRVILTDVFAARECDDLGVNAADLLAVIGHPNARHIGDIEGAAGFLEREVEPGDVVITLGAGDGYRIGELLLERLTAQRADWRRELELLWGERLLRDEPMSAHTWFRVGGPADALIETHTIEELCTLIRWAGGRGVPVRVIGSGSNLLVADGGIEGLVVVNGCDALRVVESKGCAIVYAEAGRTMASLSKQMTRAGYTGLEWALGLPGTVGGALVGNAGAFGRSLAESLIRVLVLDLAGEQHWVGPADLGFAYRTSRLKRGEDQRIVLAAELQLQHGEPEQMEEKQRQSLESRRRQPIEPSAGSVFKNPPGLHAARLIEAAGLKGLRIGDAEVSSRHANFIVNRGKASARDVLDVIEQVRAVVRKRFEVELELEILCVGRDIHSAGGERKAG